MTEIIRFLTKVKSPRGAYGTPRWHLLNEGGGLLLPLIKPPTPQEERSPGQRVGEGDLCLSWRRAWSWHMLPAWLWARAVLEEPPRGA